MEETKPEQASEVYERACKIHLPRKPSVHFAWASFEEKQGLYSNIVYVIIVNLFQV